jgi:DNA-binding beta-propeller fold protein YncE
MIRSIAIVLALAASCAVAVVAATGGAILPSGWHLSPPAGPVAVTGTMPQGIALSPDGTRLAVVESGVNPAALRILHAPDLALERVVPLKGAFGKPVWQDATTVWVAGAATDSIVAVDASTGDVKNTIAIGNGTWPAAIALSPDGTLLAIADDGTGNATLVDVKGGAVGKSFDAGSHPSDIVFSRDGAKLYAASRAESVVRVIRVSDGTTTKIAVGKHPSALALAHDGATIYAATGDDDAVDTIDTATDAKTGTIDVAMHDARVNGTGTLPNALVEEAGFLFVSLGGANAVAVAYKGRVLAEFPTGWYPTGVAVDMNSREVYVSNGKGEGMPANPGFDPRKADSGGYVGSITVGSVRAFVLPEHDSATRLTDEPLANAMPHWTVPHTAQTVIRPHGPIRHVIYVIKENRSYDQVLGDVGGADGAPSLVWFGRAITPNQHALAKRFGVFDNAYANSQVSADGHNWTDAAIANDYTERFWPVSYGDRRKLYDYQNGAGAHVPHNGYIWDAAARARIGYRDYGEDITSPPRGDGSTDHPGLQGHFDAKYAGWNLGYSDLDRYAEWNREFQGFVRNGDLPALEIVYLPNDHTSGTAPGKPTPQAYVAINDLAVGKLVDTVSHSSYWKSTAIFVLEDDAQNGPDHVSDQRSTFYIASPYARGGVQHAHYSTAAFIHTIELILGLPPLSLYDTTALPLYAAFGTSADVRPYAALTPSTDLRAINAKTAYGATQSARMNWREPDAVDATALNDILAHVVRK